MAFLVAGTLRLAAQTADTRESLSRKGRYSMQGPRMALVVSNPGMSAVTVTLKNVLQALGFEGLQQREVPVQSFLEQLIQFREQLDAHGGPIGCVLVALVAPRGQLRRPQKLVRALSCCGVLHGCPKLFLLLSSSPGATLELGTFLPGLVELSGCSPHWSLLQLLTEVFRRATEESSGGTYCPVLCSSLRGTLCLGDMQAWGSKSEPTPSAQYDLSGAKAALLLTTTQDRPGAQRDVEALKGLCHTLGFKTTVRIDSTAQAFQEELVQFREQLDTYTGPVSCALVALMAHGGTEGQLFGADGQEVQPEALVLLLSRCRALQYCPKIFLIQACRGGHRDPGVGPTPLSWFWRWLHASPTATIPSHSDILQVYADVQGNYSEGPFPRTSSYADVLMIYAAAEGYVAYRNEKGSDFIQTLVEVLGADPERDLLELMTEVNRRVCELEVLGPDSDQPRKACLEIRSSLRRRLCLRA